MKLMTFSSRHVLLGMLPASLVLVCMAAGSYPLAAQESSGAAHFSQMQAASMNTQGEAMQKVAFLVGQWSGPITIFRGPGEALHLTQTEEVESKLGGLVLLVEGKSTDSDGKVEFSALATIAYDDASHTYRFRAYNNGRYLDTPLSVVPDGFSWGFDAGPAHITNTMHLSAKGEWNEVTNVTVGSHPSQRSMEMLLEHLP